jgi:hypothetical protein
MNPKIEHLLLDLRDWLAGVASVHDSFKPIVDHIDGGIDSDLRSLKLGLPFDGIMRGFPIGVADTAHNSDESAGSDDSSERQ